MRKPDTTEPRKGKTQQGNTLHEGVRMLTPRAKRVGLGAVSVAGVAMLALATNAAAATAIEGTPTGNYQLCGTVYSGAAWAENSAPPSGAQGVSGVTVTGTLYNADGSASGWTGNATSGTGGDYCVQGTSAMATTVTTGGYVVLTAASPSTPSPWASGGNTHIGATVFNSHAYGFPPLSAYHFNFAQ